MISFIVGQASWIAADLWLALWSGNNSSDQGRLFLWVFVGIIIFTVLISIARSVLYFQICLNTCEVLFGNVLTRTIKSPMSFFERTPHGRLMNRFAKDMNYIEEVLKMFKEILFFLVTPSNIIRFYTKRIYSNGCPGCIFNFPSTHIDWSPSSSCDILLYPIILRYYIATNQEARSSN